MERLRQRVRSSAPSSSAPSSGNQQSGQQSIPMTIYGKTIDDIKRVLQRLTDALESLETATPQAIIQKGAKSHSAAQAIGQANNQALRDGTIRQGAQEALGMRNS
jgi:hypothetical protein